MYDVELSIKLLKEMSQSSDGRIVRSVTFGMSEEATHETHQLELLSDAGHVEIINPQGVYRIKRNLT